MNIINKIIHTVGRYWFFLLIVILVALGAFSGDSPSPSLPPPIVLTNPVANQSTTLPIPVNAVSLPTGTVLKRLPGHLQGDGTLEIDNGTSQDAVAKLITGGTSVYTVYIKANSNYTIKYISDGTYWLAFTQGTNWDSNTKKFTRNNSFSSFQDTFDFETTATQYTTYSITLNPVVGGTARTDTVNGDQFSAY